MNNRLALHCSRALVALALALPILTAPAHARISDSPDLAQSASQPLTDAQDSDRASISPKTAADGLQLSGNFTYSISGGNVTLTLDRITNASTTRTTGTLRLELWATTTAPAREAAFSGYRLATSTTLAPLGTNSFYANITRTASFTPPPDGTYWLVLVLSEFSSTSCSTADNFCITDSAVLNTQRTFGGGIQIVGNFSFQTSGSNMTLMVDRIENNSLSDSSGTLRLELWATTTQPPRGARSRVTSSRSPIRLRRCRRIRSIPTSCAIRRGRHLPTDGLDRHGAHGIRLGELRDGRSLLHRRLGRLPELADVRRAVGPTLVNVIEFYHTGFDHYFITGITDEINKLDTGFFAGWTRTGQQFKAFAILGAPAGTSNVCRFFSTAFGARNSRSYTLSASECLIVKGNPQWQFEAEVAAIASPVGSVPGSRTCAAGYVALYRLYNNGKDGARTTATPRASPCSTRCARSVGCSRAKATRSCSPAFLLDRGDARPTT